MNTQITLILGAEDQKEAIKEYLMNRGVDVNIKDIKFTGVLCEIPLLDGQSLQDNKLNKKIDALDFPTKAYNIIKYLEINTVGDLLKKSKVEVMRTRNCGKKTIADIDKVLGKLGLKWE